MTEKEKLKFFPKKHKKVLHITIKHTLQFFFKLPYLKPAVKTKAEFATFFGAYTQTSSISQIIFVSLKMKKVINYKHMIIFKKYGYINLI